jgi:hypothetical protein
MSGQSCLTVCISSINFQDRFSSNLVSTVSAVAVKNWRKLCNEEFNYVSYPYLCIPVYL